MSIAARTNEWAILPLCQNESSCETIHTRMSSASGLFHVNQSHFNMKGFARNELIQFCSPTDGN